MSRRLSRALAVAARVVLLLSPAALPAQKPLDGAAVRSIGVALGQEVARVLASALDDVAESRKEGLAAKGITATPRTLLVRQQFGCADEGGARCSTVVAATLRGTADSALAVTLGGRSVGSIDRAMQPFRVPTQSRTAEELRAACLRAYANAPVAVGVTSLERRADSLVTRWFVWYPNPMAGCDSGGAELETRLVRNGSAWVVQGTRTLTYH